MYKINNILLHIISTWVYEAEDPRDLRNGMKCFELKSSDERYSLITDAETLSSLELAA